MAGTSVSPPTVMLRAFSLWVFGGGAGGPGGGGPEGGGGPGGPGGMLALGKFGGGRGGGTSPGGCRANNCFTPEIRTPLIIRTPVHSHLQVGPALWCPSWTVPSVFLATLARPPPSRSKD